MQDSKGRFVKGITPWNKGKKMPQWIKEKLSEAHKKSANTNGRFKQGHPDYNKHKPREKHPRWKGGTTTHREYVLVSVPGHPYAWTRGFYVKRSRLVMEKYLGRYLKPEELIHHINEDRTDDRIENLQIVTRSEHRKIHLSH